MPSATHLAIFALAALAMNAAPGPSNLYVLSRSLAQGAAAGLVSALGLALGNLFHVALAVAGLAALLRYAPTAYDAIRLAGAAYLIYLGVKTLRAPGTSVPAGAGPAGPQFLLLGLIVTLTALPCDSLVALAGAKLARLFAAQARRRWPSRLAGSTLIGLGIYTALMRRSA